jgi:hypothetical protein
MRTRARTRTAVRPGTQRSRPQADRRCGSCERGSSGGTGLLFILILLLRGSQLRLGPWNVGTRRLVPGLTRLNRHGVSLLGGR